MLDTIAKIEALLQNLKYLEELPEIRRILEERFPLRPTQPAAVVREPTFWEEVPAEQTWLKAASNQPAPEPAAPPTPPEPAAPPQSWNAVVKEPIPEARPLGGGTDFEELRELLNSPAWPPAVDGDLICNDTLEEDKMIRAEGILDFMVDESLEGKKFLDFGCGEGHVVVQALPKKPLLAVGYDLHEQAAWAELAIPTPTKPALVAPHRVTSRWEDVVSDGPFDVVLMYDVLDHAEGDPVEILRQIKSVLKPGGRVYIRCHPWCSRSATHLYKRLNKAYMHLVFSDDELAALGFSEDGARCARIIHPHASYKKWFNDAGLDLSNENGLQENVEEIFSQNKLLSERIKNNWRGVSIDPDLSSGKAFPSFQLRIQFIDYVLKNNS